MSDDVHSPTTAAPMPPPAQAAGGATEAPPPADESSGPQQLAAGAKKALDGASERPEALVGAAFAGGLVVALLLKRITRG